MRPYKLAVAGAALALVVAAATVLVMGMGLRTLVDQGFSSGDSGLLDRALFVLMGIIVLLALATYSRYSLVSWLGELVVADLRARVFDHVLRLDAVFF